MIGGFAHNTIFLIRDCTTDVVRDKCLIFLMRQHRGGIISHLSWICLWLGFHSLGLYIHNDTAFAFCEIDCQILIEPWRYHSYYGVYHGSVGSYQGAGGSSALDSVPGKPLDSPIFPISAGDLLADHAISVGLHLTVLILLKGSLDGPGSKLMPDKIHFGYGFSCDGPGRGGSCDISAWDSFYLATFWMVNTGAWITFYIHWKHLTNLNNSDTKTWVFDESSTYLNGWFRDYLLGNVFYVFNKLAWLLAGINRYHHLDAFENTYSVQSLGCRSHDTCSFIYCSSKVCWGCSFCCWLLGNLCSFYYMWQ